MKMIAVFSILFAFGCGSRSVGFNNNNANTNNNNNANTNNNINENVNINVNTNQNNNNEVQPNLLTYRIFTNEFVEDILEYEMNPARPCTRDFPDMEDNDEDDRLCRNMMTLDDLHADQAGYPDGYLHPDYADPRATYWLTTIRAFGFFLHIEGVLAQDVGIYDWYAGANGNLTHKGLLTVDEDALAYPSNTMTLEEWDEWKTRIQDWLNEDADRVDFLEVLLAKFYSGPTTTTPSECVSQFGDVDSGSFECMVTDTGLDYGLIEPDNNGNYRPFASLNWPEIIKMTLISRNIPQTTEECWEPCNGQNLWYCPWVNAACMAGILPSHLTTLVDMQIPAKRLPTFKWLYKFLMLDI